MYKSQVNRLTDIVRTSVDCSSFASINAVVKVRSMVMWQCDFLERRVNDALSSNLRPTT